MWMSPLAQAPGVQAQLVKKVICTVMRPAATSTLARAYIIHTRRDLPSCDRPDLSALHGVSNRSKAATVGSTHIRVTLEVDDTLSWGSAPRHVTVRVSDGDRVSLCAAAVQTQDAVTRGHMTLCPGWLLCGGSEICQKRPSVILANDFVPGTLRLSAQHNTSVNVMSRFCPSEPRTPFRDTQTHRSGSWTAPQTLNLYTN